MVLTGGGGNVVAIMGVFGVSCNECNIQIVVLQWQIECLETSDASRKLKTFVTDTGVPRQKP